MTEYSASFRKRMVQRMTGLKALSAAKLAEEVGVPQPTLSRWLRDTAIVENVTKKKVKPAAPTARRPSEWPAEDKLRAVVGAASVPDPELGGWLRREGLREEDLERFRADAIAGLAPPPKKAKGAGEQKRIKELERELKRKDAALAETAALLVLRKKAVALWGEEGENT